MKLSDGLTKRARKKKKANEGTNSVQNRHVASWVEFTKGPGLINEIGKKGISSDGIPGKIHKSFK
jgi:hypothetical protein